MKTKYHHPHYRFPHRTRKRRSILNPKNSFQLVFEPGNDLFMEISIDERHNLGYPIERIHDLPRFRNGDEQITDGQAMRKNLIMTTSEHCEYLMERHGDSELIAFCGFGNLLANPNYIAWNEGKLFHLGSEDVFHHHYPAMVTWLDGRITFEEVSFARENGRIAVFRSRGDLQAEIGSKIRFLFTGVCLVRAGKPLPIHDVAAQSYDTRHVVQPLALALNGTTLFFPNAQLQEGLLKKAAAGSVHIKLECHVDEKIVLPLSTRGWIQLRNSGEKGKVARIEDYLRENKILSSGSLLDDSNLLRVGLLFENTLRESLSTGGYRELDIERPLHEGEFRFVNSHLQVHLKPAVYPHSIFLKHRNGTCSVVFYTGRSGREGTTLRAAQEYLCTLDAEAAILLDNGGDVRLHYRGTYLVPPFMNRPEIRAILALMARKGSGWRAEGRVRVS